MGTGVPDAVFRSGVYGEGVNVTLNIEVESFSQAAPHIVPAARKAPLLVEVH